MASARRFNLLLVRDDGARVLRLTLPRWAMLLALGGLALGGGGAALGVGALYRQYRGLEAERATLASVLPQLHEQQALLDTYRARARDLRAEIDGWRQIHARILEPFGPDAGLTRRAPGVGGTSAAAPRDEEAGAGGGTDDFLRLASLVQDEGQNLRTLERFLSRAGGVLASLPSRWPLRGPVNSDFGRRMSPWVSTPEFHSGLDIGAPVGTPVRSPAPGTVVFAGRHAEYGLALVIDHGHETKSLYGHLSKLSAAVGQKVRRGDVVAFSGNTGRSSGPHLHYEIQVAGQSVNPHTYLWE
jgi:murein DD-endopeptidase MepM/ murein hydrolase activator NlpD